MKKEFAKISSNPSFSDSLGIHYASLLEQVRVGSTFTVGWNSLALDIAWADPYNRNAIHLYSVQLVRNCIVALIKRLDTEITSETISVLIFISVLSVPISVYRFFITISFSDFCNN